MEAFQPLINLLVLMSTLSIAAERIANAVKLRDPELSEKKASRREEKERERQIAQKALAVSIVLAVVIRADFFEIVSHLQAPWETLGWKGVLGAGGSVLGIMETVGGAVITGISLGFGSKFWHEVLDAVSAIRENARRANAPRA